MDGEADGEPGGGDPGGGGAGPTGWPGADLDPALAAGLTPAERAAAEVHVLRARADSLRGPRTGERALALALRASRLEAGLLSEVGVEAGAALLEAMEHHPATEAAVERWRYAQELAERVMRPDQPADG